MNVNPSTEQQLWDSVKEMMGDRTITLGSHWSYNLLNDPKRLAFVLSRYKFAAKTVGFGKSLLELGCSEGIGTPILAEFAASYTGIDMDREAVDTACRNWSSDRVSFMCDDFLGKTYGTFDAIVSLDVIEHIQITHQESYFDTLISNLADNGIAVIGTPSQTSEAHASEASKAGHVNLFTGERLKTEMARHFHTVLLFGMNDEVVHTGFAPMAHYLLCVGIKPHRETSAL